MTGSPEGDDLGESDYMPSPRLPGIPDDAEEQDEDDL